MGNYLILFTANYPFGKGETFIENEIFFLSKAFDKVIIISNNCKDEQTRSTPENVTTERFPYEINFFETILYLVNIFSRMFWKEINIIRTIYKRRLSVIIIKTMMVSMQKSKIFGKRIKKIIDNQNFGSNSIYCYSYWANDMAITLSQLKRDLPQVIMFCRAHGWDLYFERHRSNYLPFRLNLFENLDSIFVISEHGKVYIEDMFSRKFANVKLSRLGVNPQTLKQGLNEKFSLVSISNIIPLKNLNSLVLSLSKLRFDFIWYHIGDGPQQVELERLAKKYIPGKYRFLGYLPNSEVLNFLQKTPVALLVNISFSEGVPVSIMEAYSFGIPVLATNVGGTAEIVSGSNGRLLSANATPEEIAQAINDFRNLSDSQKIEIRRKAFNTWNEKYNAEKNYEAFVNEIIIF